METMGCVWVRRFRLGTTNSLMFTLKTNTNPFLSPLRSTKPISSISFFSSKLQFVSALSCSSSSSVSPLIDDHLHLEKDGSCEIAKKSSKVLLKGMRYSELENWVQSHGFRPGQALMLWKRLYGNEVWAHSIDELQGLNKDFMGMLRQYADLKALSFKNMRTASDGSRKEVSDFIYAGRWSAYRNSYHTLP